MNKLQKCFVLISNYINKNIWKYSEPKGIKGFLVRILKVLLITGKEFEKDQISLKASAMTYWSILSIVPLIAMIFGISKGFGIESLIQSELDKMFIGQEKVQDAIFGFAQNILNNTKGGVIVGVSIVTLFFTVMKLLTNIENVFNSIWGKKQARSVIRKFTDYLALLVVAPIFISLSSGVTIFVENQLRSISQQASVEEYVTPMVVFFVQLSSFILVGLLFTMIYVIMPNVNVKIKHGLIAGLIASSLFQLVQKAFITFSFLLSDYGAIYGSLVVLPLFFIFNQLSWTIVFVGGELSYALQHAKHYMPINAEEDLTLEEKNKIALLITHSIVEKFNHGQQPFTKGQLATHIKVSFSIVSDTINRLVKANVLTKSLSATEKYHTYLPSMSIDKIDIYGVLQKLAQTGVNKLIATEATKAKQIEHSLFALNQEFIASKNNKLLKDI